MYSKVTLRMVHTHPLPPIDRRNNIKQKTRYQKTTIIIKQSDFHRHKSLDSQKTYQQKPDIFQNKPKEHNKQLHRTNQTEKISQQAP